MTMIEMCRTLIDYNDDLNRKLWKSIFELTEDQFTTEMSHSHGSVRNQMIHMTGVDGRWLRGLKGSSKSLAFRPEPENYTTRQEVFDLWDPIAKDLVSFVHSLKKSDLKRNPPGMPGPTWQVIFHLANHSTDHRAQVLRLLHDFGAPTFDQDLILHLWPF